MHSSHLNSKLLKKRLPPLAAFSSASSTLDNRWRSASTASSVNFQHPFWRFVVKESKDSVLRIHCQTPNPILPVFGIPSDMVLLLNSASLALRSCRWSDKRCLQRRPPRSKDVLLKVKSPNYEPSKKRMHMTSVDLIISDKPNTYFSGFSCA